MAHSKRILIVETTADISGLIPAKFLIGGNPKKPKYWFSDQADLDAAIEALANVDAKTTVDGEKTKTNSTEESDGDQLLEYVSCAINKFPDKVKEYKNGKKSLLGLFMGEVMKQSKGNADPKKANQLVREALEA